MSSLSSDSNKFFEEEPKDMDWISELKSKSDIDDINGFVECTKKFIDYTITYLCDKSFEDQIIISREYFQILKDFLKKEWRNFFLKSIVQFVFDVIIEENSKYWCIKKELLKIFVCLARESENRKQIVKELPEIYLLKIMDNITFCGDYDMQVILIDTIFLLYESQYINSKLKDLIPESEEISKKFANISTDTFQKDCRLFLNVLNKQHNNIYSSMCKNIQIEHTKSFELLKCDNVFWIDFNIYNKAVSWYQLTISKETEELDVELITLFATEIKKITVTRCDEDLIIHFNLKGCLLTSLKGNESDYNQSKNVTMVFDINDTIEKLHEVLLQIFDMETYETNLNLVKKVSKKSTTKRSATQSYLSSCINDSYFFTDDTSLTLSNKSEDLNHNKDNVNSLNIGPKKCSKTIINVEDSLKKQQKNKTNQKEQAKNFKVSKCLINNSIYKKSQTGLAENVRKCSTSIKLPTSKQQNEEVKKFKKVSECLINNPIYKKSQTGFAQNVRKCSTSSNLPTNKQDSLKGRSSCSEKENINKRANINNSCTTETFKTAWEFASLIVNTGKKTSNPGNQSEDEDSEYGSDFIEKLICTNKIISPQDSNKDIIEQKLINEIDKKVNKEQISSLNDAFAIIKNNSKASSLDLTATKSKEIYNSFEKKDKNAPYMLDTIDLTEKQTPEKSAEEEEYLEKENGTTFKAKTKVVKQKTSKIGQNNYISNKNKDKCVKLNIDLIEEEPPESLEEDKTNKSKVTEDSLYNQRRKKLPDDEADLEISRDVNKLHFTDEENENKTEYESNLSKDNEDISKTASFDMTAIKSEESYDSFGLIEKNSPYLLDIIDLTEECVQEKSKDEKTIDFPEKENGTTFKAKTRVIEQETTKIGQDKYISNKNKKDKCHELNKTDLIEEESAESLEEENKANKSKVIEDTLSSKKIKHKPDDDADLEIGRDVIIWHSTDEENENKIEYESNLSKDNEDISKTTSFDMTAIKSRESYDSFELKEKNSPYLLDTIDLTEEHIQEKSKEKTIDFPGKENGTTFKAKTLVIVLDATEINQNELISNKKEKDKCHELNKTDLIEEESAESLEEEDKTNKSKVIEDTLSSKKIKHKPNDDADLEIGRDVNIWHFTDEEQGSEIEYELNLSKVIENKTKTKSIDLKSIKSGESNDSFELKEKNSPYVLVTIDLTEECILEESNEEITISFPEKENGTTFKAKTRVIEQKTTKIGQDKYICNKNKKDKCHELNKTDLVEEEYAESLEEEDKINKSKVIEDTLPSKKIKYKPVEDADLDIGREVNIWHLTDDEQGSEIEYELNLSNVIEDKTKTKSIDLKSIKSGESNDSFLVTIDLTEDCILEESKEEITITFPEKENGTTFKAKTRVIEQETTKIGQDKYICNKNKKDKCHELNKTDLIEEESAESLEEEDKINKSKVIEDTLQSQKRKSKPDDKAGGLEIRRDVNRSYYTDEEKENESGHESNLSKVNKGFSKRTSFDMTSVKYGESYDSFQLKDKNSPYLLDTIDLRKEHIQEKSKEKTIDFPEKENETTFKAKTLAIVLDATEINQNELISNKKEKDKCHGLNISDLTEGESPIINLKSERTNKCKYNSLNRKRKTKLLISSDEKTDFVKSKKPKFEKKRNPVIYKKNKSSKTEFKRKKGSSVFLKTRQSKKTIDNFKRITKKLDLEDFKIEEKDFINDKRTDKLDIELTEEESLQGENTYNSNIIKGTSQSHRKRKAKLGIFSDEEEEVGKKESSKKTIIECISKREYKTTKINEKCKRKILDLKDYEAKQKNVTNEISKESDKLKEPSYLSKISLKEVTPESIHKFPVGDVLIKKQDKNNIFTQSLIDVDNIIDINKTHIAENPFEVLTQENTPNSENSDKVDNIMNINGTHISESPFEVLTQENSSSNEVHTYEAIPEKQNDTTILEKVDKQLYINEKHISDNTFESLTKINSPIPEIPEDVPLIESDENIFTEAMDKVSNKIYNLKGKSSEFHEDEAAAEQQDKSTSFSQLLDEINDKMYTHNSDFLTFSDIDVNLDKNKNDFTTPNEPFEYFENLQEKSDVSQNHNEDELKKNSLSKTFIDNITENLCPLDNVNTNKPGSLNQSYNEIQVDIPMEIVSNDKVKFKKEQRINQKFNGLVSIRDQFEQCIGEVVLENTPKKDAVVENQVFDKFDNASRSSMASKDKSISTTLKNRKKLYDPNSIKDLIINTTVDTIPEHQKNEVPLENLNDSSDNKPQKSYKRKSLKTKTEKILESFNLIKKPVKYDIPFLRSQGPEQLMKMKFESIYQKLKPEEETKGISIKSIDQLLSLHKTTKNQNINIYNMKYKKRSNKEKNKIRILSDIKLNGQSKEPEKDVSLYEEESIDSYFQEQSLINATIAKWTTTAWFNNEMVIINSTDYLGKYVVLFFYPLDFIEEPYGAPPTEILYINEHYEDFLALKTEVFGCSVDSCFTHKAWLNSLQLRFPLLSDMNRNISKMFKMSYLDTGHSCRGFYIMDPKGVIIAYSKTDISIQLSVEKIILTIKDHQTKNCSSSGSY